MLRKLEKYEILEEIGHGGMATVYRAHDTVLDRAVALKVMHPHLRAAEEARKRFHREARSVARLRHPRVLEIYDFSGEGSEEAYIAAELLTGPTLKQWRENQKEVPAEIAACFVIEIARALEAAHAARVVHRDVKPENVLLHENRTLKLTDFGIADMVDAVSMTATGQILGSPGHMAPEQIEGKDCDARTDLFSLGTVLYYLATGRLPFTGRNPHQVLKRIIDGEYADPLRVNPTIGGRMRTIIVKSLEREPDARYQSARALIEELERFIGEVGIEDAEATLERYLADPAAVGAEIRKATIDRSIEHGARASDAGDVPSALDYYNRVLALDEGNERVLKLIERVGMDRRRRMIMRAGAALMAVGGITALGAWVLWPGPSVDRDPITPIVSDAILDAGSDATTIAQSADAGAVDARIVLAQAPDAGRARRNSTNVATPSSEGMRQVVLRPNSEAVRISIDGQPAVPFGPQLHTVELAPGSTHIFAVEPTTGTYRSHTFRVRIPSGEGRWELPLALELADAALFVNANVPGQVRVDEQSGSTGELLSIAMREPSAYLRVKVTAPGHAEYNELVMLRAGQSQTLRVHLEPERSPTARTP